MMSSTKLTKYTNNLFNSKILTILMHGSFLGNELVVSLFKDYDEITLTSPSSRRRSIIV